ncbi:spore germination protein [Effusibacillus pohliae]|uniref:spore germination protein n=1 Tax=Effusibacillus pohliae TaxID=232270 RepID=UPI000375A6A0|nr:spore germination protein [Effusibacillus pohliae]
MSVWSKIGRLLTVDDSIVDEDFSLAPDRENGDDEPPKRQPDRLREPKQTEHRKQRAEPEQEGETETAKTVKPKKLIPVKKLGEQEETKQAEAEKDEAEQKKAAEQAKNRPVPDRLSDELHINRALVENIFHLPQNADVIIRDFTISREDPIKAFAVFMEGLADKEIINSHILEPLMLLSSIPPDTGVKNRLQTVKEKLLPGNQVMEYDKWEDVTKNILAGSTAVFIDGAEKALIVESKGWEHRSVAETTGESVVRGPHDAFTENLRTNTGLVRSRLRTERLITEMMQVGELASTDIAVMYVNGIANPRLVHEVKRRIKAVKVAFLQDSGVLEQFIEDPPRGLIPRMLSTERPDRVAAALAEGYVAVFVGQSPFVLIMPAMIWSLLHTAEDAYIRAPFGSMIRVIRFAAFLTALLLPALYIAVTNYHPEMIPTDLMLAIAAARERVPFPAVVELLLMELAIELIREAGIRIPNVIGPTIGIVGALILGQAAVQAGIVSPLLVIVVAVTALSSFTLPNYNVGFAIRTLRFVFLVLAGTWGFYGIILGLMVLLMHWACLKSFGVPMLSPVAPYKSSSPDVILRGPVYAQEIRPAPLYPQDRRRQRDVTRPWDPTVRKRQQAETGNRTENREATDKGGGTDG